MRGDGLGQAHQPGPCERHLLAAFRRGASLLRAAIIGVCGTFGLIAAHGHAGEVLVPLIAAATAVPLVQAWHRDRAPRTFVAADVLVAVGLGLAELTQPYEQVAGGWVLAAVSITAAACRFERPDRPLASVGIAAAAITSYLAAAVIAEGSAPMPETVHLMAQTVLAWVAMSLLRRAARLCDALIDHVAQRRATAAAAKARHAADRAHLAMLHDTASTTFLMVSTESGDEFPWLRAQAARDLDLLAPQTAASDHDVDLATLLRSLRGQHGLQVDVVAPDRLVLPARPALAILHGAREGLTNVRRHSGDTRPRLSAREQDGTVLVELVDRGCGFDPATVPAHRQGLSSSIRARAADAGLRAEVRSAIGAGTSVTWTWSRD
ncbi:hypothetical protein HQ32_00741 [Prauserella sp. Am3]|nr:hypothetical protein HQ32_00741 [Prauserella sp. Am3]